jgi:hypothetical protein
MTVIGLSTPSLLSAQSQTTTSSASELATRIRDLERQLAELQAAAARLAPPAPAVAQAGQRGQQTPPAPQQGGQRGAQTPAAPAMPPGMVMPGGPTGGDAANPEGAPQDSTDPQALLDRIKTLEQRIRDLESSTVLSEPETRVKKVEVYVDKDGVQHDTPVPGAKKEFTFQRERVYRRQTISEKIEEALADAEEHNVKVGVNAGIVTQMAHRTTGTPFVNPDTGR